MPTPMITIPEEQVKKEVPLLISMKISFGPAFSGQKLTNKAFIARLKDEGRKHSKSFMGDMLVHFSEHVEAAIKSGHLSPDDEADLHPLVQYNGQGSCTGCPGDDGTGSDCCLCSYNGVNTGCENCN